MSTITKEGAVKIAKKLRAELRDGPKHFIASIFHDEIMISRFGIRRGGKDEGHDYIISQLFVTNRDASRLALCPMSLEEWIQQMKDKGIIPSSPDPAVSAKNPPRR